ncbi:hypothetical protein FRX31_007289 [Thalictrum thalictroides]|uniref:Uncharacterized protein n=1 Tax=Thalictrum thalictroides TaxID=46969 RepID=A0A7J6X0C0_THATH|nr:hypothetical protein FRX31_007289 [Thalictrum thalictroides]
MIVHQTARCGEIIAISNKKDVGENGDDEEVLVDIVVHETNRWTEPRFGNIHDNFVLQDDPEEYQFFYQMKFIDFDSYENLQERVGNILLRTMYLIDNTFESLQKDITDEIYNQFINLLAKFNSIQAPIVLGTWKSGWFKTKTNHADNRDLSVSLGELANCTLNKREGWTAAYTLLASSQAIDRV